MLHSDILYNDVGTSVSTDSKTNVAFSKKKRKYFGYRLVPNHRE
jgi:hypothetical protein